MIFNSFEFAVFFIVVTILYFLLPHKYRWILLLLSSCYFYMAFVPVYILILGFTIIIDYIAGIYIERSEGSKRKFFFMLSLFANIGVLAVFKYYNFFIDNVNSLLKYTGYNTHFSFLSILLPIGLSFHTFQAMSYTFEVYRGNYKAEKNFGIYALYVMFYPQLVAGPIERPQNILYQFRRKHTFDYNRVVSGLQLILWGLFKKVVIADRLAILVDRVYDHPKNFNSIGLILATIFFCYQIFCDFSGYTDIARGCARVMGFTLLENFNKPYHAKSISDFWSRWHISLSTWFRDYLYIPLGGNRTTVERWYLNLFIVFMVSGLWHGAAWTFIIWGALHGCYLVFGLLTSNFREKATEKLGLSHVNSIKIITTFALVTYAWIFFRANNINDGLYIATHIITGLPDALGNFKKPFNASLNFGYSELLSAFLMIFFLELVHNLQKQKEVTQWLSTFSWPVRWGWYITAIVLVLSFGAEASKQFIYFQF